MGSWNGKFWNRGHKLGHMWNRSCPRSSVFYMRIVITSSMDSVVIELMTRLAVEGQDLNKSGLTLHSFIRLHLLQLRCSLFLWLGVGSYLPGYLAIFASYNPSMKHGIRKGKSWLACLTRGLPKSNYWVHQICHAVQLLWSIQVSTSKVWMLYSISYFNMFQWMMCNDTHFNFLFFIWYNICVFDVKRLISNSSQIMRHLVLHNGPNALDMFSWWNKTWVL